MRKSSLIIFISIIIIAIAGVVGYILWNKPFTDPLKGDAIEVSAIQLFKDFSTNEAAAQKKYVPTQVGDKKIQVNGEIKEIGKNEDGETFYVLKAADEMFGVKCIMQKGKEISNIKVGDSVTVRGFCDGYIMDVIVNRCKPVI